jgi:hypothetical protein
LNEVSSCSGLLPSAIDAGLSTGKRPMSMNCPAITLVTTLLNDTWLRPGARNPLLAAARRVTRRDGWTRRATLPLTREPKSL